MSIIKKERPVLVCGAMVRAVLADLKTQTRRVVMPQPDAERWLSPCDVYAPSVEKNGQLEPGPDVFGFYSEDEGWICPYGAPGDRLWVRENCWIAKKNFGDRTLNNCTDNDGDGRVVGYSASMSGDSVRCAQDYGVTQSPSIHMPRWASRITLEIVNVRVERVQDISEEDAIAEGVDRYCEGWKSYTVRDGRVTTAVASYRTLWDSLNAKRGFGWDKNPWVWVVEFKREVAA